MRSVYLAGPITGLTYDGATDWRDDVAQRLWLEGITPLSPLRGKDYLRDVGELKDQYHELNVLSSGKGITTRDRWDCQRADVVLMNLVGAERVSIGSVMEAAWADAARVPLVLAMEEGGLHDHAMMREVAGYVVPTLDQAVETTLAILSYGEGR